MTWQIFPNVTFTNGSKNIAVNDSTATAGILAGYAVNKDNKSYEIESITSSVIILVDDWAESTATNVKIKIQPTSEPIKEYIQETLGEVKGLVADYLTRLQLEESIISSTGTVPFTDSAGVSHDIPGWGNLNSVIQDKLLTEDVWMGSSVEYGSNANGEYWKYPDGKLVCSLTIEASVAVNVPFSGAFRSYGVYPTFPHAFISAPRQFPAAAGGITTWGVVSYDYAVSATKGSFLFLSHSVINTPESKTANLLVIGVWK